MTDPDNPFPELTYRQSQIVVLIGEGIPYKRVAAILGISHSTVSTVVKRIAKRFMAHEPQLSDHQKVLVWVRQRQWERQREAGVA